MPSPSNESIIVSALSLPMALGVPLAKGRILWYTGFMSKKEMNKKISAYFKGLNKKSLLKRFLMILFGSSLDSLGAVLFILPSGLITGGSTGLSLFINHFWGLEDVSIIVFIINVVMFTLGWIFLGKEFAFASVVSSLVYPGTMALFNYLTRDMAPLTTNPLLCAIFGGLFIGVALGFIIRAGASSGGMDVPPLILHKFTRIPLLVLMYGVDVLILLLQAIYVKDAELILTGILMVLIYSVVMEVCISMGNKVQIKVITKKSEEVRTAILKKIDRGVTMLHGQTGYTHQATDVVMSVISNRELSKLQRLVQSIDPEAFLIISRVAEVRGRGFTADKRHLHHAHHTEEESALAGEDVTLASTEESAEVSSVEEATVQPTPEESACENPTCEE